MPYVFSTTTCDQRYQNYTWNDPREMPTPTYSVFIKGGTGVANDRLITPIGVMTEITDQDLIELEKNEDFKRHKKAGFIVVQNKKDDPEKVAANMARKDKSAPITESDFIGTETKVNVK